MLEKQLFSRRLVAWTALNFGLLGPHYARLVAAGDPGWRILLYQRVLDPETAPYPIPFTACVTPKTFERHCFYLWKNCNVVSLGELLKLIMLGKPVPPRTVAITFDGGHVDFYQTALPILKRYKLPAAVFMPTVFIGTDNMPWTDKAIISLSILATLNYPFPKFPFLEKEFLVSLAPLGALDKMNLQHIGALVEELKRRSPDERLLALGVIAAHVEEAGGLPTERSFMNWEEVKEAAASGLVAFGSAGHRYAYFPELEPEELRSDISDSVTALRAHGLEPVPAISFPEGRSNKEVRRIMFESNVKLALGAAKFPPPNLKQESCALLGRTAMFEAVSFCPELFACRLWDYKAMGLEY